jgi:oligoribonuclease NrnB/cAMP/cGMP phosphodiesterase (DHH superfamily)
MNNKIYDFVFFHYPCQDGLSSAWIVNYYHNQINSTIILKPIVHTTQINIEELKNKRVLFCDISPSLEVLENIEKVVKRVTILDHHISAQRVLESKEYAIFDMNMSGAGLTWNYFFPEKTPLFIEMIQDRDLWTWKIENSKDFTTGFVTICSIYTNFNDLFLLFNELYNDPTKIDYYINFGSIINIINFNKIKNIADSHSMRVDDYSLYNNNFVYYYKVCIVNCEREIASELGNILSSKPNIDFAVLWQYNHPKNEYYVSLRSNNKVDVSLISKQFSGGGHKNAAGFTTNKNPIDIFVNTND